ncbi:MarR family winged helix-turn-helix transcriptional regulator [Paramicrobacterium sp. CJ85]|uniref:MarR family winged helix-turn-helix transcriptional regulator n=1 Tax=Paramicrobacterium sp. CJ85 TaxID=3445355 RepID=UPI003F615728
MPDEGSESLPDTATLIGELVASAHRLTRVAAQAVVDPQNPAIWRTISALLSIGPARLGELARQSRVTQPTMTKIIQHLVELDWVRRVVDPSDARAQLLEVTDAGSEALAEWRRAIGRALAPHFAGLGDDDLRAIARTLEIVDERTALDAKR